MSGSEPRRIERLYQRMTREQIGFRVGPRVDFVVENGLCHGCGTCAAVCPEDAIEIRFCDDVGGYAPFIDRTRCTDCELCVLTCSGFELDLPWHEEPAKGRNAHLVGPHRAIHRAWTTDVERRARAASGGLATEILAYLLETARVEAVLVTRMSPTDPLRAEGYLARSVEQLTASQKSKYCPVPLNQWLKGMVRGDERGPVAFLGLPHHVHGLRLLQRVHPHLLETIPWVLSIFTAHVPSQRATDFVLYHQGLKPEDVKEIEYRGGGNPGRMRILTRNGEERLVPHLHWSYWGHAFPRFFYPMREWLYFDKLSEQADFSCGDNWQLGEREQRGASTVVTRSEAAEDLVQELARAGRIKTSSMSVEALVRDQALHTKLDLGTRLWVWRLLRGKLPIYNRHFPVSAGELLRSLRLAGGVRLSEGTQSFPLLSVVILADYWLRAVPRAQCRPAASLFSKVAGMFLPCQTAPPSRRARFKVVLIGGYGHKDIGDEAMPHAVRQNLRELLGDELELVMLSPYPESTEERHHETSRSDFSRISPGHSKLSKLAALSFASLVRAAAHLDRRGLRLRLWPGARLALDELGTADALVNVGGGNINSIIPSELYKKCTTYHVAATLGVPVYLSGQTMGPYFSWFDRAMARRALNKVRVISFRDKDISHNRLKELRVSGPVMFDAADDAFTLEGVSAPEARQLVQADVGLPFNDIMRGGLALLNFKASLSVFKGVDKDEALTDEVILMARVADRIVERLGARVLFCATDFSDTVDDRVFHRRIRDLMSNRGEAFVLEREYTDEELIGIVSCGDIVFGARYHFNVFAASRGVPFVGIASGVYQRTKLSGLAGLCGLPQCYVDADMGTAALEDVWLQVEGVYREREAIRRHLAKVVPGLKEASWRVVRCAVDDLRRGPR